MKRMLRLAAVVLTAALVAVLAGCSAGYLLDNRVQSFSHLQNLPSNATYRFDRLPSQQADPVQAQLEALADQALFKAGFKRDDATPKYAVQVTARVQRVVSPWADPWTGPGFGWGWRHRHFGLGGFGATEQPWFQREVGIVVRELPGNKVVYESHAASDGPFLDNAKVLPAMFEAAMQGFPNPPQGVRRVDIQIAG